MSNLREQAATEVSWTTDALQRLERAPVFLRGMVRRLAEKKARELGYAEITGEILDRFKSQMMGGAGERAGSPSADEASAGGRLPWTAAARERLASVPEFMRPMIEQITEEIAKERGHLEVNVELYDKVESLGDPPEGEETTMEWTDGAVAMLHEKLSETPPIAVEFVSDMLKRDAEDLARQRGANRIDETTLRDLWESPLHRVAWTDEAWKRLQSSPDFVRSGIRKAAERRARKLGLPEIDSAHLTLFRNQAMMKAVKRIRSFGYRELTFDAFETALQRTKRLQGNDQAQKRLQEIRNHFADPSTKKPEGDTLGAELMDRFRKYLKGEGSLP
ncbi:MAG: PCP reductase family protein [Nitrospira sp.]|nr:PCP reductase family protein [Nitrospira sp.]MCP9460892.1 PCP reductase family protein [Nitrospira sp.]MCP9473837.1 PCP reductase family protein [Nitrospira sp.]